MNKQNILKTTYREYKNVIIYGLVGINIFGMIVAVRVYLNYRTIQESIAKVEGEKERLLDQNRYTENFNIPYLNSSYADYFLAHENNGILPGEKMIRIQSKSQQPVITPKEQELTQDEQNKKPQDAWKSYLEESLGKNSF